MQVRVRSLIPIAIVSNRDAFVIHNTHLPAPACRTKRGEPPFASRARWPCRPSPLLRLPRSLRLPTATATSRWRRTPTPCGPRCASHPRSTTLIRRTPWQPLRLSSEKKRKEVRRTRDHDSFPLVTVARYNW